MFKELGSLIVIGLMLSACCNANGSASSGAGPTRAASNGPDSRKPASFSHSQLMATCLKKKVGICDSFYDFIPTEVPNDCVKDGGEFKKGSEDCPSEGFAGACAYPPRRQGEPAQLHNLYSSAGKVAIDTAKKECLEQSPESVRLPSDVPKEWIAASPAAAKSATPSTKGK